MIISTVKGHFPRTLTLTTILITLVVTSFTMQVYSANFRRGDVDGDGTLTLSDIYMLAESEPSYGSSPPACWDALDANNDGFVNISDAIYISNYLFSGGAPPPTPFPGIGADPSSPGDTLDCQVYNDSMQYVKDDLIIAVDRRSGSKAVSTYEYYGITLKGVIDKIIATSSYPNTTALQFYQRWWSGVTGNGSQLATQNPFTGTPSTNPAAYMLVAIVNRFDTAPADWSTCGSLRLIFGRAGGMNDGARQNRNLVVFDAEVPNPTPGLQGGCSCYYQNWNTIESYSNNESTQAYILQQMLFVNAGLYSCSMGPAIHYSHFSGNLGRILANSFIDGGAEYAYREFNVTQNGYYGVFPIQVPVADSIALGFFQDPIEPALSAFKDYLDIVVPGISDSVDFHELSVGTEAEIESFQALSSRADRFEAVPRVDYFGVSGPNIRNHIQGLLDAPGGNPNNLAVKNILDRMNSLSCGACHSSTTIHWNAVHPSNGGPLGNSGQLMRDLGDGVNRPTPFTFHHINEFGVMSEGMRNVILKERNDLWTLMGY